MPAAKRQRAPWGSLSREQVIEAAERSVQAGNFDQMTIRSLAAELNVSPMSLYRHVRDKDDLLAEVVDRMLSRRWRPRASPDDWMAWTIEATERFRNFLVDQPAALHIYLRQPVVAPSAIARMRTMIGVLENAGFDAASARRAYGAIHTYAIGFASLAASRARQQRGRPADDDDAALFRELEAFASPRQFREGLRYLLEGIDLHHHATCE
jgi:TetR/AcrR family transcriptional regulator, tetracycline repressor protein